MQHRPGADPNQRAHRSAVSNGQKLFSTAAGLDGRTHTARPFRDLYEALCNDLGGASGLKEGQRQLAGRAATLSVMSEAMEANIVREAPSGRAWLLYANQLG